MTHIKNIVYNKGFQAVAAIILTVLVVVGISFGILKIKEDRDASEVNTISELAASDYDQVVYINENGTNEPYLIVSSNYNNTGAVALLRKNILPDENTFAAEYENAYYENSNIDKYLTEEYIKILPEAVQSNLLPTSVPITAKESLYSNGKDTTTIQRAIFLPSYTEVGCDEIETAPVEGSLFVGFFDDDSRVAIRDGMPAGWMLRTAYTTYDREIWTISPQGVKTELPVDTLNGIRPVLSLNPNTPVVISDDDLFFITD